MGFAVPIGRWFQGPLRERVKQALCGERIADSGLFDMARMARLVDEHASGARDHSAALWSLLMFEGFLRRSATGTAGVTALKAA
jgi:asparagine synthase (glutamine-hydrolysing)